MPEDRETRKQAGEPTVAPGLEMDELEAEATDEEVAEGDYTSVTKLVVDRLPEDA
ncbi:hypothetical protein [Ammoniphilus sp. YIM 78166]|uniref:hypothetical protein n=1 Tax=Ammoniphilus sp. YIM 78166 TaxID=1644106 RepID=UPI00142F7E32|nr:hypothetical protein [Ammoniphilus sp. YIM 78166]